MSSASSNQSFVCDGAGYDEVYPSGHKDHDSPSERSLSASSSMDEDSEMEKSNGDFSDGLMDLDPSIQFVIEPDGLREFILLPLWTVNDFISKKSRKHTSKHLGISIKYPTTYLCVYPTKLRSVTTRVLKP